MLSFWMALLVVVALASYAAYLWDELRSQRARFQAQTEQLRADLQSKNLDARQSIQIIARALLQNDLSDTEAAMRIGFLSQQVIATEAEAKQFEVFQQLAEATAHIPILDDWAMLEKSEKRRLNAERKSLEAKYADFIQAGAQQLVNISLH
ncbi:MAG: DUF2489 domain-containing protein [Porticoccaceae bacterium]